MAWTQSDLDAIDKAIASGTEEVKFADRSVRYRSVSDLMKARAEIINNLAQQSGPKQTRQIRVFTDSGWGC